MPYNDCALKNDWLEGVKVVLSLFFEKCQVCGKITRQGKRNRWLVV